MDGWMDGGWNELLGSLETNKEAQFASGPRDRLAIRHMRDEDGGEESRACLYDRGICYVWSNGVQRP